jgi:hypothetical protein
MTEEEIFRFALQLSEAERIRALMVEAVVEDGREELDRASTSIVKDHT